MPRLIRNFGVNRRSELSDGELYGIEVEWEGVHYNNLTLGQMSPEVWKYWSPVHDGSLREGVEFISKPLGPGRIQAAINALWGSQMIAAELLRPSVRTGIHIHCSCLGLNTDQVMRILQHYALLEPMLFHFCGGEREENIYCIPWYRSHDEPKQIFNWLSDDSEAPRDAIDAWDTSDPPTCKYSALHVGPLMRYGTIEFRMAPTWRDHRVVMRWFTMVQAIWRTNSSDYNVLEKWGELGPDGFCRFIFGQFWHPTPEKYFLDMDVEHVASLLMKNKEAKTGWGKTPTLNVKGSVTGGGARISSPTGRRVAANRERLVGATAAPPRNWFLDLPSARASQDPTSESIVSEMLRNRAAARGERVVVEREPEPTPPPDDMEDLLIDEDDWEDDEEIPEDREPV
jgi:hypothetical protein